MSKLDTRRRALFAGGEPGREGERLRDLAAPLWGAVIQRSGCFGVFVDESGEPVASVDVIRGDAADKA
jgi:hypothetical protein